MKLIKNILYWAIIPKNIQLIGLYSKKLYFIAKQVSKLTKTKKDDAYIQALDSKINQLKYIKNSILIKK
jgi:hypothetical protein